MALLLLMATLGACGEPGGPEADARMALGRQVFLESSRPPCATCHTLRDAGTSGQIGPNLDQLQPDSQRVAAAVTNGVGIMPPQGETLSDDEIAAVAHYVARAAGANAGE